MSIKLPDAQIEGLAHAAGYLSATVVFTVPADAKPWAKAVFRHIGTSGFWYGSYNGHVPTTSLYDFKLAPGDPENRDNMPIGAVRLLASGPTIGDLEFTTAWKT